MKTTLFRNMFATIAALFISMFALPQQAQAEDYNLWIAGTQVTSANCADLSVIDGVSGTVKYDPATKTLTLDNATINSTENYYGISSYINGLTVEVKGTVNVTAQDASTLLFERRTTITGGGTLNATSSEYYGLYTHMTALTIDGCTVNAKGKWGIAGYGGNLTIRNATVTAEGNGTKASICDFKTLTLIGCAITRPAGAAFDPSLMGVALDGALVTEKVTIEPSMTTYNLKVADTQVTSANCNDLSVIDGVSGTAKYDPATNTLTLDNATINSTDRGIESNIDGLTVQVKGTVNVTAQSRSALMFSKSAATVMGDGTLNATSGGECGIYVTKAALTIAGCTVNAKGGWGIAGRDGSVESLTLRYATVTAEGTKGSICDFKTLTLDGCEIAQPAGAAFNASLKGVALDGALVTEKVTISLLPVSNFVVIDGVKKPIFSYEFFDVDNDFALRFHLSADGKELVQIEGNRNLHTGKDIDLTKKESAHDELYWTVVYATDFFSWSNCHRVFTGSGNPDSDIPVFTNGTLRIDGDPAGTFTVSLKNGRITADTNSGDGEEHTIELMYSNDPTGIDTVTAAASVRRPGTYTLHGVKLDAPLESLPAGVYIYNGKKVVKK